MTVDLSKVRIFIRPGPTDLRKSINGLSVLIYEQMNVDPFNWNVYLFTTRKGNGWNRSGTCAEKHGSGRGVEHGMLIPANSTQRFREHPAMTGGNCRPRISPHNFSEVSIIYEYAYTDDV
jgi:hypothetical protein